ncbi:MAG: hypothetical protein NVS1B14_01570 [Vulcanimicrobiaceae bacterium]
MKQRQISVAVLQLPAHDRTAFSSAWTRICDAIRAAARTGAQLIVLPEGTVPGYVIGSTPVDSSLTEQALRDVRQIAAEHGAVIVYGSVRPAGAKQYNSAYVVDADGRVAGHADKSFLWHFDRQWFSAGALGRPIPTAVGRLGVMICADGRIPTIARALVAVGAEILVMPTAWVTSGRDPRNLENVQADLLARVRARENDVPFVAATKIGVECGCVAYCGKSQIIDASGRIQARATQNAEETLAADVVLRDPQPQRAPATASSPATSDSRDCRIAISADAAPPDAQTQRILETAHVITSNPAEDERLARSIRATTVDDAHMADPAGLVPLRLNGFQLMVWRTQRTDMDWVALYARARALELRVYVVCIASLASLAFAVDPDGTIVAGTFGDLRIATFTFSPERTRQTQVAPGTDIIEGLRHVGL